LATPVVASSVATLVGACSVPTPVAECSDRTLEGASLVHRAAHLETQGVELAGDCLDSPSLVEASLDLEAAAVAAEALASAKVAAWAKDNPRVAYLEEEASGRARHLVVCSDNQQVAAACSARVQVEAFLDNLALVAASLDSPRKAGCLAVASVVPQQEQPRRCRRSPTKKPS